jgi:hypothetical protein
MRSGSTSVALKVLVAELGFNASSVSAMTLRVSGASALAAAGWHSEQIRIFGGWKSQAVLAHIRASVISLEEVAGALHHAALRDDRPRVGR